ncbi:23S rRNA (uracil(1939)-C(5))-methyltransferase RlmD [Desulfohalovibrio reitneri]|uniref:23S rRNA (uracil(1939)-C(5))-methyltransferase RlmD n=1 Tax=Desulfohalovibrio reitneri TaxID=1307759 RepID=UPI0004A6C94F|nr:23S rRNA (uracil(1939)-C(5))-methyltransferase RlmD [Desulfohalovibrio reitneri]
MENGPQPGEELLLRVEKLVPGGRPLAREGGLAVMLDRGLPGQTVRARVVKRHKGRAEAEALEVAVPRGDEAEPFCRHFGECGGCLLQDLPCGEQLRWKAEWVRESLLRTPGACDPETLEIEPARPSPRATGFRNKMEFAFSGQGESLRLGLHKRGRPGEIFDVAECPVMEGEVGPLLEAARRFARDSGLPSVDPSTGKGFWRHLVVRRNLAGQAMAVVLTNPGKNKAVSDMADDLFPACPELVSIVHGTRKGKGTVARPSNVRTLWGADRLSEELCGLRFELEPRSFFQTNTLAAEGLFATVADWAVTDPGDEVLELYCGAGAISLVMAGRGARVTGVENVGAAVEDAVAAMKANGLTGCRFLAGDAAELAASAKTGSPRVVVADPPRAGLAQGVARAIWEKLPEKVVMVSCNPATLARDVARLGPVYGLSRVRAFDLFPHAAHVEAVAELRRR